MHKHQRRKIRRSGTWKNSNSRIDDAATSSIINLFKWVDDGECDPALRYLADSYLSKFCDETLVPSQDRREAAIAKFLDAERENHETSLRLRGLHRDFNILPRVTFNAFLGYAQRLISEVLGQLDFRVMLGEFSGGASTSRRRTESSPAHKFVGMADATESALGYVEYVYNAFPLLRKHGTFDYVNTVKGSVLFTVPKKTDIDRCACKEPDINMFLQKGVGNHIRRRLRRFGVDLNDQTKNKNLSRLGSLDGSLATLDLSSASDSISTTTVLALLPHDWFLYLNDIRSKYVSIDGEITELNMFSSMGNGFTFELESLLFWALMRTTAFFRGVQGIISVYGDDLIIPSELFDYASWTLGVFGFTLNHSKSFSTGPFRESCGGHYHYGLDITPFYLKRAPERLTDVIRVANQLRHWLQTDLSRTISHPKLYQQWCQLRDLVPKDLWGGNDTAVDTQLVTTDFPSRKLVRVTERSCSPQAGLYLHWHSSNWGRTFSPTKPRSDESATTSRCRKRSAPPGASVSKEYLYQEIFPDTVPG